jgi:hypothetical protein
MAWWGSAFVMQSYGTRRTRVFVAWRRNVIPMLWFRTVCFQRRRNCQPPPPLESRAIPTLANTILLAL